MKSVELATGRGGKKSPHAVLIIFDYTAVIVYLFFFFWHMYINQKLSKQGKIMVDQVLDKYVSNI